MGPTLLRSGRDHRHRLLGRTAARRGRASRRARGHHALAHTETLRNRNPRVIVRTHKALVVEGEGQRLVLAGGGTSWLDLAPFLIARTAGIEVAMQTARVNVIDWHDIGQQPFARLASGGRCRGRALPDLDRRALYDSRAPVGAMARLSGLPERSFERCLRQATGMSPLEYVHTLRLEGAKQMLEAGREPIEPIASAVGYEGRGFFRRLFRRRVGLTPAQYRRRFGSLRRGLESR